MFLCFLDRLPNAPIVPVGLTDVSGTTSLLGTFLLRSSAWLLGNSTSLAWPRCVLRTLGGSNSVVQAVNGTPNSIGYVIIHILCFPAWPCGRASVSESQTLIVLTADVTHFCVRCRYASMNAYGTSTSSLPVAAILNKAGNFVTPQAAIFPFNETEMPSSIASPDWMNLDLNATGAAAAALPLLSYCYMFLRRCFRNSRGSQLRPVVLVDMQPKLTSTLLEDLYT